MEEMFKLKENNTNVRTELIAGMTTFLSMAYILSVNPIILSAAGMDSRAVFVGTAISAAITTLFMGVFANYPVALASGMGLNAYFTYSICIPMMEQGIENPWKIALFAVFIEGILFILLSISKFRETLINDVPQNLKYGITVGIGLFITLIGLVNAGIVVGNDSTIASLGNIISPQFTLAFIGLVVITILHHYRIICPILWGILITWGLGMVAQTIGWYKVDYDIGNYSLFPIFDGGWGIPARPELFSFDFKFAIDNVLQFAVIVFSFLFVDLFDTVGGLIGIADKAGFLDKDGKLPRANRVLMADAVGTVVGASFGTSTVTTYMESCAGVVQGGRTGLTSVTTAVLFILALFLSPIFLAIPSFATAPALIFVGWIMIASIKKMTFEGDVADSVGGFIAITMTVFSYSIANGIMFGILSWVILKILCRRTVDIPIIMWVSSILFMLRIATMV